MHSSDYYGGGLLRRWVICEATGQARCFDDAVAVAGLSEGEVEAIEAANAAVHTAITAVESYEAALRLTAGDEPEQWIAGSDEAGEPIQVENPTWTAWNAALAVIEGASEDTLALYQLRAGGDEPAA